MQQEVCVRPRRLGWNEADYQIETPLRDEKGASLKGKNKTGEKKGIIPLFFATDDNYLPFLSVTLQSLRENSSLFYFSLLRSVPSHREGAFQFDDPPHSSQGVLGEHKFVVA